MEDILPYFPKETNCSPLNYCTQLRAQALRDGSSFPLSSSVALMTSAHRGGSSASKPSVGKQGGVVRELEAPSGVLPEKVGSSDHSLLGKNCLVVLGKPSWLPYTYHLAVTSLSLVLGGPRLLWPHLW